MKHHTYETEARERWGETDAYREHTAKTKHYSKEKWAAVLAGMDDIFARFASCQASGMPVGSAEATALAAELQKYITENFYTCTNEILRGLGQMYVCDERFRQNTDRHGSGTAEFVCGAVAAYCREG